LRLIAHWQIPAAEGLILPVHYNHLVQAMLYASLAPERAAALHDEGHVLGSRHFRLFTFSRLFGTFQRRGETLHFRGPVALHVASPFADLVSNLAHTWARNGQIVLGRAPLVLEELVVPPQPELAETITVETLSPITVYRTLVALSGKKTYYYAPFEADFALLCTENLCKKYAIVQGEPALAEWAVQITPLGVGRANQVILRYKGTVIKGWTGRYRLAGPPSLLSLALDAGLGAKNSQGFGMLQLLAQGANR
jgi:CRISPR-associated endoribonuclease Cas6